MKKLLLASISLAILATTSFAGDPVAGEQKARSCAGCHGVNGISNAPVYPNLAGQKEMYLVSALKAYKTQERRGGSAAVMWGLSAALSEQDIKDLAAFYANLDPAGGS